MPTTLKMIPFGVVVLAEPGVSDDEMRKDLENIRRLHFNTIVLYPCVSRWEGNPPGHTAFATIDRIMDWCLELGLKVILELQGQVMQDADAPEIFGYRQSPNYRENGFHDPAKEALLRTYFREVVSHFKGHPALLAYDLFNEIGNFSTSAGTIRAFASFLRRQYAGDIQALNRAWATYFREFEDIEALAPDYRIWTWSSVVAERDWQRFRSADFVDQIRWWREAIREIDPGVPLFVDVLGSDVLHNRTDAYFGVSDWDAAGQSDILGLSCYANMLAPDWWKKDAWLWPQFWRHGLSAGGGRQVIISELMTSNRNLFPDEHSSMDDEISLWSHQAIFHGIQGLIYWKYRPFRRGRQVGGRGLTDFAGVPNAHARQASEAAQFAADHAGLLGSARPDDAGCAILFDPEAERLFTALGIRFEQGRPGAFYTGSHRGWFRAFWSRGISPSYLTPGRMGSSVPDHIRVLAVPCLPNVSASLAAALRAFVQRGGVLLTDARFGILDENANLQLHCPGAGLHQLLGFEESSFSCRFNDRISLPAGDLVFDDDDFQTLRCAPDAEILLRTQGGLPALVHRAVDDGSAMHVPFLLGQLVEKEDSAAGALACFDRIFARIRAKLNPAVEVVEKDGLVDVSTLLDPSGAPCLTGLCNFSQAPSRVCLRLVHPETLSRSPAPFSERGAEVMELTLPPRSVRALFFNQ
jgi:hypothetical protein